MYTMLKTIKIAVNSDQKIYIKGKDFDLPEDLATDWTDAGYCKKKEDSPKKSKGKGDD